MDETKIITEWLCYSCAVALGWNGEEKTIQGWPPSERCDCCLKPASELKTSPCTFAGNSCRLLGFTPSQEQVDRRRATILTTTE